MKAKNLFALCAIFAIALAACSKGDKSGIGNIASTSDVAVAAINLQEIAENAGCTVTPDSLIISDDIKKLAIKGNSVQGMIVKALSLQGIDLSKAYAVISADQDIVLTAKLTNQQKFIQYVTGLFGKQPSDHGDYVVFAEPSGLACVATKEQAFLLTPKPNEEPVACLQRHQEAAKTSPLADWQIDYLNDDETARAIMNISALLDGANTQNPDAMQQGAELIKNLGFDPATFAKASLLLDFDLDAQKLDIKSKIADAKGKSLKSTLKISDIDASIGKYAPSSPLAAMAFCLPKDIDWKTLLDAYLAFNTVTGQAPLPKDIIPVAAKVLDDIDGTTMLVASDQVAELIQGKSIDKMEQLPPVVLASQMKKGKAKEYVTTLNSLASTFGLSPEKIDGGFKISLQYGTPFCLYVAAKDNTFVASTAAIADDGKFPMPKDCYDDAQSAFVLELPAAMIANFCPSADFDLSIQSKSENNESEAEIAISGTQLSLLQAFIKANADN